MGPLERVLLLAAVGFAFVLIVSRTMRAGSASTTLVDVASGVSVALAVVALVAALGRAAAVVGAGGWTGWTMRGVSRPQRRAMVRALRHGQPVPVHLRDPARGYLWVQGTADRQVWMPASIALMQAALGGGRTEMVPVGFRLVLVLLCAVFVTFVVVHAARWRRIGATSTPADTAADGKGP